VWTNEQTEDVWTNEQTEDVWANEQTASEQGVRFFLEIGVLVDHLTLSVC
jgi:hypothetical protein